MCIYIYICVCVCIYIYIYIYIYTMPQRPLVCQDLHYPGYTITLGHTTFGRTPLYKWLTRHRDLYLTTHDTNNRQPSMPPAGFEPAIPASERPQSHVLDRAGPPGSAGRYIYRAYKLPILINMNVIQTAGNFKLLPWQYLAFMAKFVKLRDLRVC